MNWIGWPLDRIVLLWTSLAYLVLSIQVTLFHYRQNFRHWSMWVPVIELPVIAIFILIYSFYKTPFMTTILYVLFWIATFSGLTGSYFHIKGVGERVEGYKLRNFLIGPPLTLPGMITFLSILGLIVLYWGKRA